MAVSQSKELKRMDAKSIELLKQVKASIKASKEEERRKDWHEITCRFCHSKFQAHKDWKPQPIMCKGCRVERKTGYKTSPGGEVHYTENQVFHGGGPGTGRRK
jgi:hypothetical protein